MGKSVFLHARDIRSDNYILDELIVRGRMVKDLTEPRNGIRFAFFVIICLRFARRGQKPQDLRSALVRLNERAVFDGKFTFAGYGDALQIFQPRKRVIIDHGNVCGKTRDLFDGRQIERIRADAEIDAQIICKGQFFERTLFQRVFRDPVRPLPHRSRARLCL